MTHPPIEEVREALARVKTAYAHFDNFGTTYATLYSSNNENDLNNILEAAAAYCEMQNTSYVINKHKFIQHIDAVLEYHSKDKEFCNNYRKDINNIKLYYPKPGRRITNDDRV